MTKHIQEEERGYIIQASYSHLFGLFIFLVYKQGAMIEDRCYTNAGKRWRSTHTTHMAAFIAQQIGKKFVEKEEHEEHLGLFTYLTFFPLFSKIP